MKVSQGTHCWQEYDKLHPKNTLRTYQSILSKFSVQSVEKAKYLFSSSTSNHKAAKHDNCNTCRYGFSKRMAELKMTRGQKT
jgi:hypothetical protein